MDILAREKLSTTATGDRAGVSEWKPLVAASLFYKKDLSMATGMKAASCGVVSWLSLGVCKQPP